MLYIADCEHVFNLSVLYIFLLCKFVKNNFDSIGHLRLLWNKINSNFPCHTMLQSFWRSNEYLEVFDICDRKRFKKLESFNKIVSHCCLNIWPNKFSKRPPRKLRSLYQDLSIKKSQQQSTKTNNKTHIAQQN